MQTRMRLLPPLMIALTDCRFGSKRRALTLFAWLCCRPTTGPFPQSSHRFAIYIALGCRLSVSARLSARIIIGNRLKADGGELNAGEDKPRL